MHKTIIGELKKVGAVGRVLAGASNRYVIVEETAGGVKITRLYGTAVGEDPNAVFEIPDDMVVFAEDKPVEN